MCAPCDLSPMLLWLCRWIFSPSSSRVTGWSTVRPQGSRRPGPGTLWMWRCPPSAAWSCQGSRRALCTRSRCDHTSTSSRAWTVTPGRPALQRKVSHSLLYKLHVWVPRCSLAGRETKFVPMMTFSHNSTFRKSTGTYSICPRFSIICASSKVVCIYSCQTKQP